MQKNRLGYFLIVFAIASLIIPINGLNPVSAYHGSYDPERDLEWNIVFATSRSECSQRNYNALLFYVTATEDLLDLYKIPNVIVNDLICVDKDRMTGAIEILVANADLTIIIPDYLMSVKQRHTSESLGHYAYAYDIKSIVVQAETLAIEDANTAWILSHEIAHFALHYYGYPEEIWGDGVHKIQERYNNCQTIDISLAYCAPIWTTIKTTSGKYFSVMKPVYTEQYIVPTQQKTSEPNQQSINPREAYALSRQSTEWLSYNQDRDDVDMLVATYPLTTVPFESADARADYKRAIEKRNDLEEKLDSALNDLRLADSYLMNDSYELAISFYGKAQVKVPNIESDVAKIYSMINSAVLVEKEFQREKQIEDKLEKTQQEVQKTVPQPEVQKTPQPEVQKTLSQSEIDEILRLDKLGGEKFDLGLYNEALIYYDEALLISPDLASLLNNKGVTLQWLANYPESLEYFQKALAIEPNNETYLKNEEITLKIIQKQESSSESPPEEIRCLSDRVLKDGKCVFENDGGGCLIATATFGSELSPQVQQLREIRDNSLLQTESGRSFMESFNQLYYSFSPEIADLERENPVFKEVVKLAITPLLSSLSLLNYVDMDSEVEVLGYGISLILLNVGMYFVLPAVIIHRIKIQFK